MPPRRMFLLVRPLRKAYRKYRRTWYQAGFEAKSAKQSGTGVGGCRVVIVTGERSVRINEWGGGGCLTAKHLSESPNLSRRGGNLGRELVDILRFRQGKCRTTSSRRKSRLGVRMPRLPMRRMPVRLERLLGLRRLWRLRLGLLLVLGPLWLVLDHTQS